MLPEKESRLAFFMEHPVPSIFLEQAKFQNTVVSNRKA